MKATAELNQKLRQKILNLPGVTERENAGIHEDAFFVKDNVHAHPWLWSVRH
jgi:hypothetical protein